MRILNPRGSKYLPMECGYCKGACKKAGKQRTGVQKYQCKGCGKFQQAKYKNKACLVGTDSQIVSHVKEGCGIWNIARLLGIAKGTVITRINRIAQGVRPLEFKIANGTYEVDELHTFIGTKAMECYVSYALCRETGQVVDFVTWSRSKKTLGGGLG
jgi:insertion element IS1 protein InsB